MPRIRKCRSGQCVQQRPVCFDGRSDRLIMINPSFVEFSMNDDLVEVEGVLEEAVRHAAESHTGTQVSREQVET